MKRIAFLLFLIFGALLARGAGQGPPVTLMVFTNGRLAAPTNFWTANQSNINSVVTNVGGTDAASVSNIVLQMTDPRIASVQTDASTNPTTSLLRLTTNQNAVRLWTGERPVDETWLDLYYRTNASNVAQVRLYRWQGRILLAPPGSTIQLGCTNATTLWISPMTVPASLATPAGVTNWVNCDQAGPPLWSPSAAHVLLPSNGMAFMVLSNRSEVPFFVSEFDGFQWSPPRWYILPTNENLTILCTFRQVALANYAGTPLQVVGPTGSSVGGESHRMQLVATEPTGRDLYCSSTSELTNAIATAVAGDVIVLDEGTFALPYRVTNDVFVANRLLGHKGMEGITFRGSTSERSKHVITGSGPTFGNWFLDQTTNRLACQFANLTFDFSSLSNGMMLFGGQWRFQNCRWTGATNHFGADWFGNFTYYTDDPQMERGSVWMLRCHNDHGPGAGFALYADYNAGPDQGYAWATNYSRCVLIDCSSYWHTNLNGIFANVSGTAIVGDGSQKVEVYGGNYGDSSNSFAAALHNGKVCMFWANCFSGKTRVQGYRAPDMFGCTYRDASGIGDALQVSTNGGYALFTKYSVIGPGASRFVQGGGDYSIVQYVNHNRFYLTNMQGAWNIGGYQQLNGNIFTGSTTFEGLQSSNALGLTAAQNIYGNYFGRFQSCISMRATNWLMCFSNNVFNGNEQAYNFYHAPNASNWLRSGYNVCAPANYPAGITFSTTDTNVSAVNVNLIVGTYKPTAAGNCDTNGFPLGWCGDSDPYGQVWIHDPALVSRGARSIQRGPAELPRAVVYPDVW